MKPIQLLPEHDQKLLEMVKRLFPGSDGYTITEGQFVRIEKIDPRTTSYIYWFEFCMTYLVERVLNPEPEKPSRSLKEQFLEFFWETNLFWSGANGREHPVDYLYKQFKKLNS